jgi:Skp family chaperone for outer membrane proteins
MKTLRLVIAALVGAVIVTGCGQAGGGAPVAVVDLAAIAQATGQDQIIQVRAQAAREELSQQLQQIAAELDSQVAAQRDEFGDNPTAEQQQQLDTMMIQARQQLSEAQVQAQAQATQIEQTLVDEFRAQVIPLAQEIATGMGARVVVANDVYLVWFDESLDITAAVIAAWEEQSPAVDPADEMAELEEELEEVEAQLEEAQDELEELQDAVEEAEAPATE